MARPGGLRSSGRAAHGSLHRRTGDSGAEAARARQEPGHVRRPDHRDVERRQHLPGRCRAVRHAGLEPADVDRQPGVQPRAGRVPLRRDPHPRVQPHAPQRRGLLGRQRRHPDHAVRRRRHDLAQRRHQGRHVREHVLAREREGGGRVLLGPPRQRGERLAHDDAAHRDRLVRLPRGQVREHALPHVERGVGQRRRDGEGRPEDPDGHRLDLGGELLRAAERQQPPRRLHALLHGPLRHEVQGRGHVEGRHPDARLDVGVGRDGLLLQRQPGRRQGLRRVRDVPRGDPAGAGQGRDLLRERRQRRAQPQGREPEEADLRQDPRAGRQGVGQGPERRPDRRRNPGPAHHLLHGPLPLDARAHAHERRRRALPRR